MKKSLLKSLLAGLCLALPLPGHAANSVVLGWNNLGMHCMDSSYAEFSILPPYNTIEAQLIVGGKLVVAGSNGYTVTYEAIADPDGSINKSSIGKGNWAAFAPIIYGVPLPYIADKGLAGWNMPGAANIPQTMLFEKLNAPAAGVSTPVNWFRAEGIPLTPYDDAGNKNPYPMMRLTARDAAKNVIASSDIVLPVSDEMDCRSCHGANMQAAAMPASGWITDVNKDREYRLNILRLHDEREFANHAALYSEALAAKGITASGLYPSALAGKPVLCAACHASEALGAPSFTSSQGNGTVPPLTASVHSKHAKVMDPVLKTTLNDASNRSACYRCHPGSTTRCLRGAMGSAVANDGSMEMQCQSCHGNMATVGASTRVGWFMEPKCQSCHTGNAVKNNGQIRYTTVFDSTGQERVAADPTFATSANTPAQGLSLYRFSVGHGGLQCSACHGSTHAEFPASHRNDNIRNIQLQGHAGVMVECTACHTTTPNTINGGPHGMHPVGQAWVDQHHDLVEQTGAAACQVCHGVDYKGTVLSKAHADRTLNAGDMGTQKFFRGAIIGCYTCHKGPGGGDANTSAAPAIANVSAKTMADVPVDIVLPGSANGVTLRVISQPQNGSVGILNGIATYYPFAGVTGTDTFTFAAYDGAKNSTLATATVVVIPNNPALQAPVITVDPVSLKLALGAAGTLTFTATGSQPLSCQWYKNGWPITGATSPTLAFKAAATSDVATYVALASNNAGAAATVPATLVISGSVVTVNKPVIVTQPLSQSVLLGGTVTLSVTGTGTAPLSYQWSKNGAAIAGATSSTLRLTNVTTAAAGNYQVRVSNTAGSVTSNTATLTVTVPPPQPRITGFTPASGPVGTKVTIVGSGFTGSLTVKFNSTTAASVVPVSATQLTAVVPTGATSGRISVSAAGGTVVSSSAFTVTQPATTLRTTSR